MPQILVTGASSGFGLAIARLFLARGYAVLATMRDPSSGAAELPASDRLRRLPLDVTDPRSIAAAVAEAGPIDVLVNNAGVGMLNALEGSEMEKIRALFETNLFGAMAMTQAVLPQMRHRRSGTIVNVSSAVTLKPHLALSAYSASKAGLNAFTESLALEVAEFGIRTRLVLPGSAPSTAFGQNARARMGMDFPDAYAGFIRDYLARSRASGLVTTAEDVAEAVWQAVTEPDSPMRIPAGADALALAAG